MRGGISTDDPNQRHTRPSKMEHPMPSVRLCLVLLAVGCAVEQEGLHANSSGIESEALDSGHVLPNSGEPEARKYDHVIELHAGTPSEVVFNGDTPQEELAPVIRNVGQVGASYGLRNGEILWVQARVASGEFFDGRSFPINGNVNLELWNGPNRVSTSSRGTGYTDRVTLNFTPGVVTTLDVKLTCSSGPCDFALVLATGDLNNYIVGTSYYLNQRSWTVNDGRCGNSAIGECLCAPTSASMQMANLGKINKSNLRTTAEDLFTTNDVNGAANRWALMSRLRSNYGYSSCSEDTSPTMTDIRSNLVDGKFQLLRSPAFSGPGHYVSIRGYETVGGVQKVAVDDPYGSWTSVDNWNPRNSTNPSSTNGRSRSYRLSTLTVAYSSLIVCQ